MVLLSSYIGQDIYDNRVSELWKGEESYVCLFKVDGQIISSYTNKKKSLQHHEDVCENYVLGIIDSKDNGSV